MLWTCCGLWLLCASVHVSVSWPLPDTEPALYGHIQSPLDPNPYPPNLQQQWELSVPEGFRIIEASADCYNDSLTILYKDKVLGKFCGQENSTDGHHPGAQPILSPRKTLTLVTQTNASNTELHQNVGFSAHYQATGVKCPPPGSVAKGQVIPMLGEYLYRDYILVICQKGHKLMMNGQEIKNFTAMCQSNGQWHLPLPECHIIDCGEPAPLLNGGVSFLSGELNQYGSVVQYYCNEPYYSLPGAVNVSVSCEADRKWRAVNDTGLIPTCLPVCGKPRVELSVFQRIFGGRNAPQGSIPWQVRLSGNGGGMLIADRWVLTAASTLSPNMQPIPLNKVKIFWGTNTQSQVPNAIAASVHLHPGYNNPENVNFDNDIALIKLPEPITFNQFVMPLCLPSVENTLQNGTTGVVSGFGLIRTVERGYVKSNDLQYVRLPVVSARECTESLEIQRRKSTEKIPKESDNMFCAGYLHGRQDSCEGDSGGPFAVWSRDHYWAAGIVSWGIGCGEAGRYGFYTRVSNFVDWIHKTMKEN